MKRVIKGDAPHLLKEYISSYPDATWEQMCDENAQAANECRDQAISEQGGLCAYCEQRVSSHEPLHRRIEHFHPKSDKPGFRNWGLDWENMLAVCDGGSWRSKNESASYPLPENLSCDEYKNHMITQSKIPAACEGHLLNPLTVPSFPNLFGLDKSTGFLQSEKTSCANVDIQENVYETTAELVDHTIEVLNLNCNRLAEKRLLIIWNINRNIKAIRDKGYSPAEVPGQLALRYFKSRWPEFFTTLRCCLGSAAEDYLSTINYQG